MISSNDVRAGDLIEIDGNLVMVLSHHHNKTAMAKSVVKLKIKNVNTGSITEYACRGGDKFKEADVERMKAQYQYKDDDMYYFMNLNNYEQVAIHQEDLGDAVEYLIEDIEVFISFWNGRAIGVQLPVTVDMKVVETEPGIKGDTVSGAVKPAKLETGLKLSVPLFVNEGDKIKVDSRTGEYMERVNK